MVRVSTVSQDLLNPDCIFFARARKQWFSIGKREFVTRSLIRLVETSLHGKDDFRQIRRNRNWYLRKCIPNGEGPYPDSWELPTLADHYTIVRDFNCRPAEWWTLAAAQKVQFDKIDLISQIVRTLGKIGIPILTRGFIRWT